MSAEPTSTESHPLADSRVRTLVGLVGGSTIVVVAFLFFDGPLRWLLLGLAVVDVLVTPYVLGLAVGGGSEGTR